MSEFVRYSKYIEKEVNVVNVNVIELAKIRWLVLEAESGHKIISKYYYDKHKEINGRHVLKICRDYLYGNWMVDLGVPRIRSNIRYVENADG